ncbi:MAG: hypothetical protein KC619_23950, partial [Myxococcales bacterium]|nr:hypothetical protein [Myxococcales bacterium]
AREQAKTLIAIRDGRLEALDATLAQDLEKAVEAGEKHAAEVLQQALAERRSDAKQQLAAARARQETTLRGEHQQTREKALEEGSAELDDRIRELKDAIHEATGKPTPIPEERPDRPCCEKATRRQEQLYDALPFLSKLGFGANREVSRSEREDATDALQALYELLGPSRYVELLRFYAPEVAEWSEAEANGRA